LICPKCDYANLSHDESYGFDPYIRWHNCVKCGHKWARKCRDAAFTKEERAEKLGLEDFEYDGWLSMERMMTKLFEIGNPLADTEKHCDQGDNRGLLGVALSCGVVIILAILAVWIW